MAITKILINNLTTTNLVIDTKLDPKRVIRRTLTPIGTTGASVDVSDIATLDELNRNAQILQLRGVSPVGTPKVSITTTDSSDDDIPALKAKSLLRITAPADVTLAADVIGAATEALHSALTIPQDMLNVARRSIRFRAILHVVASHTTDTWQIRVRLGGLTGTLLFDGGAIDIANNNVFRIEGIIQLKSVGASGKFIAQASMYNPVGSALVCNGAYDGAVDTTAARTLAVTGTCSTNDAGNQVALKHFELEVLEA